MSFRSRGSLSRPFPARGPHPSLSNGIHVFSPSSTDLPVMIRFVVVSSAPWDLVAHPFLCSPVIDLPYHSSLPHTPLMPNPRAGMELGATTALYPLHRCKTIYLVRHAQGIHNVAGEKDFGAYMSHELFDAQLTPLGWNQVDGLREHVKKSGLAEKIELVITSPLLRTMQTAVGVFGGEKYTDGVNAPPLMVENAGHSGRPAVSSLNCPPFIAVETCREHLGVHPCDKRRSITEYRPLFPAIDFSLASLSYCPVEYFFPRKGLMQETAEPLACRLWTREEKEIAIVSHSGFLFHTLSMYSKECHPTIRDEVSKHFANCELRSMVLVDRSMLGSYSSRFNYAGKNPTGLDVPSDIADKKQVDEAQKN
ncbi:Phosphoglycerate mutase-like protein [Zea mays]|uniref:Phosphoglycerate mutase-like protein n=2 Tax=Zea mays TaxID=4577 RepID=A0A1D6EG27_MAIZE|nr:Phosphoglycerate mutase-like protein [Zea mays]